MKRYLMTVVLTGLTAASFAAPGRTGLAQAKSEFSINRDGDALLQLGNRVAEVRTGDLLQAASEAVLVDTVSGASLLVGPDSQIHFGEKESVVLKSGTAAFAVDQNESISVTYQDITIAPTPLSASSTAKRSVFVTKVQPGDSVIIQAAENDVTVKNSETGDQIAFVSSGDTIMLIKEEDGWRATAAGQGQPFGGFRMQEPSVTGTETATEDDDDDDKAGWLWWGAAGVGAAAAAGSFYYYKRQDHKDDEHRSRKNRKDRDDDDEERPRITPITPPNSNPPPSQDF